MKVAAKLVLVLLLGITLLLGVDGYLLVQREIARFEGETSSHASELGRTFTGLVADVWETCGQERALKRIEETNREDHLAQIRWVWVDAGPGDPHAPSVDRSQLGPLDSEDVLRITQTDADGVQRLFTYFRIPVEGKRPGALEISESLSKLDSQTRSMIHRVFVLTGAVVLISAVLAAVLGVALIGRPLKQLAEKATRVGEGDLSGPLRLRGGDELAQLAVAFNSMCEKLGEAQERARLETEARIAALEQLRHEDRLRTVGRLASGIAHELGTPLNVISGRAGLIAGGQMAPAENVHSANIIRTQTERMTKIIQQLLDFARRRSPQKRSVDLLQLARQTIDVLAPLSEKRQISVSLIEDGEAHEVQADPGQMQQVLMNLLVNAFDAVEVGGRVEVGLHRERSSPPDRQDRAAAEYECLRVQDDGEGISEENIAHVFEPFFTTKDVGRGTGLGLSIAHGILREHGGWIRVESELAGGTRFSVYLPREVVPCAEES